MFAGLRPDVENQTATLAAMEAAAMIVVLAIATLVIVLLLAIIAGQERALDNAEREIVDLQAALELALHVAARSADKLPHHIRVVEHPQRRPH